MGRLFRHIFKANLLKLIGFFIFLALGACSGGGVFSGGGGVGGGGGGALDGGNDTPPDSTQNTPLDEVQLGPVTDYYIAILVGHCSLEGASCPAHIPNEFQEETQEEGCYQVKFDLQLTVLGNPLPDSIIRVVETFKDIYKDFKTNAEGKAHVQLTVGPNRVFQFYKALPAPEYSPDDPWKDCPDLSCIASTYVPIQTFMDETCQAILYPDSSPGTQFRKINGQIFHIGPLLNINQ